MGLPEIYILRIIWIIDDFLVVTIPWLKWLSVVTLAFLVFLLDHWDVKQRR